MVTATSALPITKETDGSVVNVVVYDVNILLIMRNV